MCSCDLSPQLALVLAPLHWLRGLRQAFPSLVPTLLLITGLSSVRPQRGLGVPVRNLGGEGHAGLEGPIHINWNSLSAPDSG